MAKIAKAGVSYREKRQWESFFRNLCKQVLASRKRGGHVNMRVEQYMLDSVTPFGTPTQKGMGRGDVVFCISNIDFNGFQKLKFPNQTYRV